MNNSSCCHQGSNPPRLPNMFIFSVILFILAIIIIITNMAVLMLYVPVKKKTTHGFLVTSSCLGNCILAFPLFIIVLNLWRGESFVPYACYIFRHNMFWGALQNAVIMVFISLEQFISVERFSKDHVSWIGRWRGFLVIIIATITGLYSCIVIPLSNNLSEYGCVHINQYDPIFLAFVCFYSTPLLCALVISFILYKKLLTIVSRLGTNKSTSCDNPLSQQNTFPNPCHVEAINIDNVKTNKPSNDDEDEHVASCKSINIFVMEQRNMFLPESQKSTDLGEDNSTTEDQNKSSIRGENQTIFPQHLDAQDQTSVTSENSTDCQEQPYGNSSHNIDNKGRVSVTSTNQTDYLRQRGVTLTNQTDYLRQACVKSYYQTNWHARVVSTVRLMMIHIFIFNSSIIISLISRYLNHQYVAYAFNVVSIVTIMTWPFLYTSRLQEIKICRRNNLVNPA